VEPGIVKRKDAGRGLCSVCRRTDLKWGYRLQKAKHQKVEPLIRQPYTAQKKIYNQGPEPIDTATSRSKMRIVDTDGKRFNGQKKKEPRNKKVRRHRRGGVVQGENMREKRKRRDL